jgi:hypothetical protein
MMTNVVSKTIRLTTRGEAQAQDENKICIRGLEYGTRKGTEARQKNRVAALAAVLQEQYKQMYEQVLDEDSIATVYSRQTAASKAHAYMKGLADQFESQASYGEIWARNSPAVV